MRLSGKRGDLFGGSRHWIKGENVSLFCSCFVIALWVGILYFNSLGNQFTNWDDGMIYQNSTIRDLSWKGIKRIFTHEKAYTYQPVRMLSYAIDYKFWKLNPTGYRITNILFYILTCIIIFNTLKLLSRHLRSNAPPNSHGRVALGGALLFAVHPVHVEAVTWLAARKEVLQGIFFFLAFYLYLKGREEEGRKKFFYLAFVLLSFLLAVLSKPSAIVFPAIILIYEISLRKNKWIDFVKKHWIFIVVSLSISVLFTSILMKVMWDAGGIKPYRGGTFFNNMIISFYVFVYNIKLLFFTINYSAAYTIPVSNPILSFWTIGLIGTTFLLLGLSLWSLKRTKVFFFSFFFFFITLLPYLNIIPISTLLADRYVFIPSFSSCFLLGIAFNKFYGLNYQRFSENFFKLLSVTLLIFLLIGYSSMTIRQNRVWKNSYTLWADAVEKYPESNTANALMGVVYMDWRMDEKAKTYLEKAIQILPYDYQSRNNLGIVYGNLGQYEKGLKELITTIKLRPDDDHYKINLAVLYQKQGEYKKSEGLFRFLLSKDQKNAILHYRIGQLYKEMGRYENAVSEMTQAMELAPHIINPYEELGNLYLSKLKDVEKAKYYYGKGIGAAPKAISRVETLRWMIQDLEAFR